MPRGDYLRPSESETVRRARPLARRRASTLRPSAVAMRSRKPCLLTLLRFEGWYVLFISLSCLFSCTRQVYKSNGDYSGRKVNQKMSDTQILRPRNQLVFAFIVKNHLAAMKWHGACRTEVRRGNKPCGWKFCSAPHAVSFSPPETLGGVSIRHIRHIHHIRYIRHIRCIGPCV